MACNYPVSDSSEDTHFDEHDRLRDVIANAIRRRRDNLQAIDRDRARNFIDLEKMTDHQKEFSNMDIID